MIGGRNCWFRFGESPVAAEDIRWARSGWMEPSGRTRALFSRRLIGDAGGEIVVNIQRGVK